MSGAYGSEIMPGNGKHTGGAAASTGVVICVGVDYHTAPVALRERVALSFAESATSTIHVDAELAETLVLSTCNRFEVYSVASVAECDEVSLRIVRLLASRAGLEPDDLRRQMYLATGSRAVRHLFRVAAGRESMVVGETQIIAQLRRALAEAERVGALGRILHRMGSCALAASRRARQRAARSDRSAPPSVCSLAVDKVAERMSLRDSRVVIVGAGDTAIDLLIALCARRRCRNHITIVNRTNARAASLAKRFRVSHAAWESMQAAVTSADVVFCCTSAPQPILTRDIVATRCSSLPPLLVVDLGVPRNVTPEMVDCSCVQVMDMDALAAHAADMPDHGSGAADLEVNYWVQQFDGWLRRRTIVPTLVELQSSVEAIRQREFNRARARLGDLDERQLQVVSLLSRRLVSQLLHRPLSTLAAHPESEELTRSARRLFDLSQ